LPVIPQPILLFISYISGEAFHSVNSELRELPAVELSTLPLILKVWIYALIRSFLFLLFIYLWICNFIMFLFRIISLFGIWLHADQLWPQLFVFNLPSHNSERSL